MYSCGWEPCAAVGARKREPGQYVGGGGINVRERDYQKWNKKTET